jgi:hypothetical protein
MATSFTPKVPRADVRALAVKIRRRIRPHRRSTALPNVWHLIGVLAEGDLRNPEPYWPHSVDTAIQGIAWAVNSGRVSSPIARAIKDLSAWDACELVAEVALACDVIGQVPQYLIRRFAPKA